MKLIIDIGNTFTKIAVFDGNLIVSFETVDSITVDKLMLIFKKFPNIKSSILSSVTIHDSNLNKYLGEHGFFIELGYNTPVPFINKYSTPHTLGKDRIAIASAAVDIYPNFNTLIIDAGTCITYDIITSDNYYLGGSISPGLQMRFNALHNFTHKLPLVKMTDSVDNIDLIGDSTTSSILSGVILGLHAEIEGIVNEYNNKFSQLKTVISGGDYKYFEKLLKSNIFATSNIVVSGLKSILDFNEKN